MPGRKLAWDGPWSRAVVSGAEDGTSAFVPAPAAGYVALRSTVTDVRGDSTVQTIYRAYQIR